MISHLNWAYRLGCANIVSCVVIGAAGGHKPWPQEQKDLFQKGIQYHFMSGIGMIISALAPQSYYATICLQASVLLFSVPLYHKSFTGSNKLTGILPPFGGMAMIIGWCILTFKK